MRLFLEPTVFLLFRMLMCPCIEIEGLRYQRLLSGIYSPQVLRHTSSKYVTSAKLTSLFARRRTKLTRQRKKTSPDTSSASEISNDGVSKKNKESLVVQMPKIDSLDQYENSMQQMVEIGAAGEDQKIEAKAYSNEVVDDTSINYDAILQSQRLSKSKREESNLPSSPVDTIKSAFSTVLIADFFIVIFFLVWFLLAAALQSSYPVVLERFQDVFQPVVVPCLTVLMIGSIASGALEKLQK